MNYVHGVIGGLSRVMNPMVAAPVAQCCTKLAIRVDVAASVDNISWALLVLRTSALFKINAERHSISGHRIARAGGCVGTGSVPTGPASIFRWGWLGGGLCGGPSLMSCHVTVFADRDLGRLALTGRSSSVSG